MSELRRIELENDGFSDQNNIHSFKTQSFNN